MDLCIADIPQGLTRRARDFIAIHGLRVDSLDIARCRDRWLASGIPAGEIDRVAEFGARWGGLALPPAPHYDGGPRVLCPDTPEGSPADGWWFEAGIRRTAVPYSFMIGPGGEFGMYGSRRVPLHAAVEGWVESVAAWSEDRERGIRVPDAIRLCSQEKAVWIAAGRPADWPPGEVYYLGTDDVMVVFTAELAAKVGIPPVR